MQKIGITGGIGSGKTTACRVFEQLGVPVYFADDEAKKMLDQSTEVHEAIVYTLGPDVLNDSGKIDKKKLAALVFSNKEKLEKLNSIVHPAVAKHFQIWLQQHQTAKYILKEAAILYESGAFTQVDKVIAVVAPTEIKIQRVMQRDKVESAQVLQRMSNQMSDDEKIKRAHFVIYNDEEQLLIPQIITIHKQLLAI